MKGTFVIAFYVDVDPFLTTLGTYVGVVQGRCLVVVGSTIRFEFGMFYYNLWHHIRLRVGHYLLTYGTICWFNVGCHDWVTSLFEGAEAVRMVATAQKQSKS